MKHPMQKIYIDDEGDPRFKANKIVCYLLACAKKMGVDMGALSQMGFSNKDFEQFVQLLGYSVCGFGDLSFVSAKAIDKADRKAQKLLAKAKGTV